MDLSIILPSIREDKREICVGEIKKYTQGIDYEIVLNTEPIGFYQAIEQAYRRARGEYIVLLADDILPMVRWAEKMIDFMGSHEDEIFEGGFKFLNRDGPCPEHGYYGKLFTRVPFIRRKVCEEVGGFIDTAYKAFFGDADLSLRVWNAGGRVEVCPYAQLYSADIPDNQHKAMMGRYYAQDKKTFRERWDGIFGEFKGGDDVL